MCHLVSVAVAQLVTSQLLLCESIDLCRGQGLLTRREVLTKRHCILKVRLRLGTRDKGTESQPDKLWISKTNTVIA